MTELEEYYNKFNEDKRLLSRHGRVEYTVTMEYVHRYLFPGAKVLDIGAGTGGYSIPLFNEGYDVTAVELVQHNLGILKKKCPGITAFKGNAKKLKRLSSDTFDVTLLFGPMYHLLTKEERVTALLEAKRVTKPGGVILVAYVMNEYAFVTYGIKERHVLEAIRNKTISDNFNIVPGEADLYYYARLEEMDELNAEAGLLREKVISPDGPANYIRPFLNQLTEEEFETFIKYQLAVCERQDLIGAGGHTVDILRKS